MFVHVIVIGSSHAQIVVDCLESLLNQSLEIGLTLIENVDLSLDPAYDRIKDLTCKFGSTQWIKNDTPKGFSANNNAALRRLDGNNIPLVLFLNDDTLVHPGAISHIVQLFQDDPELSMVAPKIVGPDGCPQANVFLYPLGRQELLHALFGRRFSTPKDSRDTRSIWLSAACLMVRMSVLQQIGYFDERFDPGYAEDIDLCYRAIKHGWKIKQCADAVITHIGGMSFGGQSSSRYRQSFNGLFKFIAKWANLRNQFAIRAAWAVGSIIRMGFSSLRELFFLQLRFPKTRLYAAILLAALKWNYV
jgi:GT2 family glycosyltransferase